MTSNDILKKIYDRRHLPALCAGDMNADISIVKVRGASVQETAAASAKGQERAAEEDSTLSAGGTVGNTCSGIARLGVPVCMTGNVGDDSFGAMILESLVSDGADVRYVRKIKGGFTLITVNVSNENREREYSAAFPRQGSVIEQFDVSNISDDELRNFCLLYVSGMMLCMGGCHEAVLSAMERAHSLGVPVVLDMNLRVGATGWNKEFEALYKRAFALCDIIFGSGPEEYAVVFETTDYESAAASLAAEGRICVVKLGSKGAMVYGPEGKAAAMGIFKVPVVDTLGAGDAFNAGFIAGLLEDCSVDTALLWGSAAGGYSVQFNGARGCPTREKLLEFIKLHS